MLRFLFIAFMVYLAYNLMFKVLIPMYQTTRHLRSKINEMQQSMANENQKYQQQQKQPQIVKEQVDDAEYIDYEEVK